MYFVNKSDHNCPFLDRHQESYQSYVSYKYNIYTYVYLSIHIHTFSYWCCYFHLYTFNLYMFFVFLDPFGVFSPGSPPSSQLARQRTCG